MKRIKSDDPYVVTSPRKIKLSSKSRTMGVLSVNIALELIEIKIISANYTVYPLTL